MRATSRGQAAGRRGSLVFSLKSLFFWKNIFEMDVVMTIDYIVSMAFQV